MKLNVHPGLSIVICTRNRPDELWRCIASVAGQKVSMYKLEVILIDDGDLNEFFLLQLKDLLEIGSIPLKYYKKQQPGLLLSRMEGIAKASYELVLFLDDDVELEADYLEHLLAIYVKHPEIFGVGGMDTLLRKSSFLWNLFSRTILYSSANLGGLSVSGYGGSMSKWSGIQHDFTTEFLSGCNMSFRKCAIHDLEAVDWLSHYSLGEDIYLSHVAKQKGTLMISPLLKVKHYQSPISRDKEEQLAYTEVVNHYHLLKIRNAEPRQFRYQIWTALGLFIRAILKKQLRARRRGYWRAIRFITYEWLQMGVRQ
jgi:glycosyltransferase involved in cell wall biosynthesis